MEHSAGEKVMEQCAGVRKCGERRAGDEKVKGKN